jgi:hypothetical protein
VLELVDGFENAVLDDLSLRESGLGNTRWARSLTCRLTPTVPLLEPFTTHVTTPFTFALTSLTSLTFILTLHTKLALSHIELFSGQESLP